MSDPANPPAKGPLNARERRILGVLVEKAKTTGKTSPDAYPMTLAALVTGCNQKSNRDPLTNYDQDDVDETLSALRRRSIVYMVEGGGRVPRYKHNLKEWLDNASGVEIAVLAELLLRGAQTEGDLRARASRMESIPDLQALQTVLEGMASKGWVVFLTPPGQKRGVVVTHGFFSPAELEPEREKGARVSIAFESEENAPARTSPPPAAFVSKQVDPGLLEQVSDLRAELEALRGRVDTLASEVRELKTALGV